MTTVVDRRDHTGNSTTSRERFSRRYERHVKKAIDEAISNGGVTDIGKDGVDVHIPRRDLVEPRIHHGAGGTVRRVFPGNKEYEPGTRIPKPPGGGGGPGQGPGEGAGEEGGENGEDLSFHISEKEFLEILFNDLELPNMTDRGTPDLEKVTPRSAGLVSRGSPNKLDLIRSKKKRLARIFAAESPQNNRIIELLEEEKALLRGMLANDDPRQSPTEEKHRTQRLKIENLEGEVARLKTMVDDILPSDIRTRIGEIESAVATEKEQRSKIPAWNESTDLRYRYHTMQPNPSTNAVMFCIMDVSGSMDSEKKDLSRLFYFLLYRFLKKNYQRVDVVFIRHHTEASEVSEHEFFHTGAGGGTFVSSGLKKAVDLIGERYPVDHWNIYAAQSSDGDNFDNDMAVMEKTLRELLPLVQGFFYTEIKPGGARKYESSLMPKYEPIAKTFKDKMSIGTITARNEIFPLFREFFKNAAR